MARLHQNNFATNLTSNQTSGVTTTPINSVPSIAAPFYIALDATNINGSYEVVDVTSKTATNINHAATSFAHTTAEEVRMVVPAAELDEFSIAANATPGLDGWFAISDAWTYASADAPTFTITVPSGAASIYGVGDRIKLTQTTVKYFIITAVADTVLTVYGGTDYTLANAAISAIYFSHAKSPLGFPIDPTKWAVETNNKTDTSQANPVQDTWYNLGTISLTIPIGAWLVRYETTTTTTGLTNPSVMTTLSTANNSESDDYLTAHQYLNGATELLTTMQREKFLILTVKTQYFLNHKVTNTGAAGTLRVNSSFGSDNMRTVIRAVCAYL